MTDFVAPVAFQELSQLFGGTSHPSGSRLENFEVGLATCQRRKTARFERNSINRR